MPPTCVAAGTGPAAVYNTATGQLDVFYVRCGNNNLMWLSLPASGNTMVQNLGGTVYATPAAALASDGSVQLVVRGSAYRIYQGQIFAGGFGGYTELHDGLIGAGAALCSPGPTDELCLFVIGTTGQVYMAESVNNGLTWQTIYDITGTGSHSSIYWWHFGGITKFAPAALPGPVIFVTGGDGGIWYSQLGGGVFGYHVLWMEFLGP